LTTALSVDKAVGALNHDDAHQYLNNLLVNNPTNHQQQQQQHSAFSNSNSNSNEHHNKNLLKSKKTKGFFSKRCVGPFIPFCKKEF